MLPSIMIRQIALSQERALIKYLLDRDYAKKEACHKANACIGEWADGAQGRLLELGCGPGKYVAMLCNLGFKVVGVDPLEFPTWEAIRKHTDADLRSGIYAEELPFPDGYFDHAACLGALLYFNQPEVALRELRRVLKPGGRLILRSVNKSNLYTRTTGKKLDPASNNLYDIRELQEVVSAAGFRIDRSFSYGFWPPVLTNLWWYLVCVLLPLGFQDILSRITKSTYHVNNIVFATRI